MADEYTVLAGLATIATLKYGYLYWMKKRRDRQFVRVGKVECLNLYPVKSCAGFSVDSAECTRLGLRAENIADRQWLVTKNGAFLTQRQDGRLALITAHPVDGQLVLSAPEMPDLKLTAQCDGQRSNAITFRMYDDHIVAHDCGPVATAWIKKYLQEDHQDLRIVQYFPEVTRRNVIDAPWEMNVRSLPDDQCAFSDYCSFLLASKESLAELNSQFDGPVNMKNFRPNIIVSGGDAWREDDWEEVRIGKTRFRFLSGCPRCLMTTVDPDTGVRYPTGEPLATLKKYRIDAQNKHLYGDAPLFGIYLALDNTGVINIGDDVYAIVKKTK